MTVTTMRAQAHQLARESTAMLIGAEMRTDGNDRPLESVDPTTGTRITEFPAAGALEVDAAVAAAHGALGGAWGALPARRRAEYLWAIADALELEEEQYALLDSLDTGKPLALAREDVAAAIEHFRYMGGWATKINGRTMEMGERDSFHAFTVREPVGVVGQIIPWNFPIVSIAWKIAPALAAGCAVILKPSEETSLSAMRFASLIRNVGLPPGALSVLTGRGREVGEALVRHPGVDRISFTGSQATGKRIARTASETLKRVTLELGGKSPVVIFPDADLDHAIKSASHAIFYNQGEVCTAGSRLLVHEDIFPDVLQGLVAEARSIRVGDGLLPETQMGPLISQAHQQKVAVMVDQGIADGADLLVGGPTERAAGFFYQPTILLEERRDAGSVREEFFGPVLVAQSFSGGIDEVVTDANDSSFGLGASVFTQDLRTAHLFAKRVRSGTVWVNTHLVHEQDVPFGGYKQSGYGRELGEDAVMSYTELKSVKIAL